MLRPDDDDLQRWGIYKWTHLNGSVRARSRADILIQQVGVSWLAINSSPQHLRKFIKISPIRHYSEARMRQPQEQQTDKRGEIFCRWRQKQFGICLFPSETSDAAMGYESSERWVINSEGLPVKDDCEEGLQHKYKANVSITHPFSFAN